MRNMRRTNKPCQTHCRQWQQQTSKQLNNQSSKQRTGSSITTMRRHLSMQIQFLLSIFLLEVGFLHAFLATTTKTSTTAPSSILTSLECICIDCKFVTSCKAYHFVETKHEQPHMTETPTFEPRDGSPTIHVNVRTIRTSTEESEFARLQNEHEAETKKAKGDTSLHGETVYNLAPVTTYEYDVVACADFTKEEGCWIRNMPQEIRDANPDFVPT